VTEIQTELPGLEVQPLGSGQETDVVRATQLSIEDLRSQSLIEPRHLALCQLAIDQARMIERSLRDPRVRITAITGLMDSYRETMGALPQPEVANRGKFEAFLETMPSRATCPSCGGHS
jgi:hypothetical protein